MFGVRLVSLGGICVTLVSLCTACGVCVCLVPVWGRWHLSSEYVVLFGVCIVYVDYVCVVFERWFAWKLCCICVECGNTGEGL